ncbi:MAG: hypothetical protein MK135_11770, partial [Polyangiaceae bacterium]|nr:hypothetical protein [Polyangiaceae bacterium]
YVSGGGGTTVWVDGGTKDEYRRVVRFLKKFGYVTGSKWQEHYRRIDDYDWVFPVSGITVWWDRPRSKSAAVGPTPANRAAQHLAIPVTLLGKSQKALYGEDPKKALRLLSTAFSHTTYSLSELGLNIEKAQALAAELRKAASWYTYNPDADYKQASEKQASTRWDKDLQMLHLWQDRGHGAELNSSLGDVNHEAKYLRKALESGKHKAVDFYLEKMVKALGSLIEDATIAQTDILNARKSYSAEAQKGEPNLTLYGR